MSNKGTDFESQLFTYFEERGVPVFETPASNDYGSDLIVYFRGTSISIQCKCYSKPVGVSAVREVIASLPYYEVKVGIVVSNQWFTRQARALARVNNVLLIGGSDLDKLLDDNFGLDYLECMLAELSLAQVQADGKARGIGSRVKRLLGGLLRQGV